MPAPDLKPHYRSGIDVLSRDFFAPCMEAAVFYRRASGYFSSYALVTWAVALPRLVKNKTATIQLIASPNLSKHDIEIFKEINDPNTRAEFRSEIVERILSEILNIIQCNDDASTRGRVLAWLIANDILEIQFAFPSDIPGSGLFHEKYGIFDFDDNERAAFTGSANETEGGHYRNYESIDVYRSWVSAENDRILAKLDQFDEAWSGNAVGLDIERPHGETLAKLREHAPNNLPSRPEGARVTPTVDADRWRHQEEAVKIFLSKKAGVLEMATGTGKTRTTLKILTSLIQVDAISGAVISMDGTDLLDQWAQELQEWILSSGLNWVIYKHYGPYHEGNAFALDPTCSILLISRGQLQSPVSKLRSKQLSEMLIAHDEVHGLGAPNLRSKLNGMHPFFGYRLGLSATPERAYDTEGNVFIEQEIGPTIFEFPLESAIERGILSSFDYIPLEYELTKGDKQRLKEVYAKKSARAKAGNPMSEQDLWIEISKVYKTAEMKPSVFATFIDKNPDILKRCIIFVETKEYGNKLLACIHSHTSRYRTYYAEDERQHLQHFARNEIDCLITCHRLSQGIDIRDLQTVVLFSSARSKLETIQRIGRCLRFDPTNPDKRAIVVDFIRSKNGDKEMPDADRERYEWLNELSKVRRRSND